MCPALVGGARASEIIDVDHMQSGTIQTPGAQQAEPGEHLSTAINIAACALPRYFERLRGLFGKPTEQHLSGDPSRDWDSQKIPCMHTREIQLPPFVS